MRTSVQSLLHTGRNITAEQQESVNLDDHTTYLNRMRQNKFQYPYSNVMSCNQLIQQLKKNNWGKKADAVQMVIDKGLNSYAPTRMLSPSALVIEPLYFIRVIQNSNCKIMDWRDPDYGDDQNIGLHDLVSQPCMC